MLRLRPINRLTLAREAAKRAPKGRRASAARKLKQAVTDALRRHNEQSR